VHRTINLFARTAQNLSTNFWEGSCMNTQSHHQTHKKSMRKVSWVHLVKPHNPIQSK
jgi:hypothetical protein